MDGMRYVAACMSMLCSFGALAGPNAVPSSLTIVYRFAGPYSEKSVDEMKRELRTIMKDSGLEIDWRERGALTDSASFNNLVVVEFRGKCIMEPIPFLYDERGPLAFTHSTGDDVLPFSEVACDEVRSSVGKAMWGGDYSRSDMLFGRALARVVAHELYHVLARTRTHAESGVATRKLSGVQLVSDELRLIPSDLDRMHRHP
jgi:hypothetical protein